MVTGLGSLYVYSYPVTLAYMLQACEYRAGSYLRWYWRTDNFARVRSRGALERTLPARMLLIFLGVGMLLQLIVGVALIVLGALGYISGGVAFGAALLISYPVVWAMLVMVPLALGRLLIVAPKERAQIALARQLFADFDGQKIAILGSYGKTSMKELLQTVLEEGKIVAATPANKNVPISHAQFAKALEGGEDVLLIEYGEGKPGDVEHFAQNTSPTHAVITGVAPAHLDRYKTVQRAGRDIFSIDNYVDGKQIYVNGESQDAQPFMQKVFSRYSASGALGWRVSRVKVDMSGTSFQLKKGTSKLQLHSDLLGRHQVGPLSLAAALGLEFGLSEDAVIAGIAKTTPFEHRMQPYQLSGAWVIDDSYNGNIEGVRAGTALLGELEAKRKLYVTPGLVDQGKNWRDIHREQGRLIASASPDTVVLMRNSTSKYIQQGLDSASYTGTIKLEDQPLAFYQNLKYSVAAGDVVMLQNDWPDNYA
jgi:UDP-N-acetylmuramoyl-tripeptide--D-alanyl-D-alanine ligase